MSKIEEDILTHLLAHYKESDFPVLLHQYREWEQSCPLSGLRLLDASPVFLNTTGKYLALLAAGAELTVSLAPGVITDPSTVTLLRHWGIPTTLTPQRDPTYDVILDCGGTHASLTPALGFVELTGTGRAYYERSEFPIFLADAGKIKLIETMLGTGEGFIRGMRHFGHGNLSGKKITLVGYGKVGRGIAFYANQAGAKVNVIDSEVYSIASHMEFIVSEDMPSVTEAFLSSDIIVTATGQKNAIENILPNFSKLNTSALLVNMGYEDEWGPSIPNSRVLNNKRAVNFALKEPTHMRYIDVTLALHNFGAFYLVTTALPSGIITPPQEIEEAFLEITREQGCISSEMELIRQK